MLDYKSSLQSNQFILADISPHMVEAFLQSTGWVKIPGNYGYLSYYQYGTDKFKQVRVPNSTDGSDYLPTLANCIKEIAMCTGSVEQKIASSIVFYSFDRFVVSEHTHTTKKGTIELYRLEEILRAVSDTLKSSAKLAGNTKRKHYARQQPDSEYADFIKHVHVGQTERNCYSVTTLCPITWAEFQTTTLMQSYTRHTLTKAYDCISKLVDAAQKDDPSPFFREDNEESFVSSNLCYALKDLSPSHYDGKAELSFLWSPKIPVEQGSFSGKLELLHQYRDFFDKVGDTLSRSDDYDQVESFTGYLHELVGVIDEKQQKRTTDIKLKLGAKNSDKQIVVSVQLSDDDYKKAYANYTNPYATITIRGQLTKNRSTYQLLDYSDFAVYGPAN